MGSALRLATALGACALAAGCGMLGGLVGTRIEIRGTQRSLEEQVLGAFQQMGREVYLLAGVRSVDPMTGAPKPPAPMTASQARALRARRRMEYNRDDILDFERQGYIGEGNDGFVVLFDGAIGRLRAENPRLARIVEAVAREENEDRRVIMQRIVDTTPELKGEEGLAAVGRILARQRRREAEPGVRVQLANGEWITAGGTR